MRGIFEKIAGSGVYFIRWTDAAGKYRRLKVGSLETARKKYALVTADALKHKHLPSESLRRRVVPFAELCEDAKAAIETKRERAKLNNDDAYSNSDVYRIDRLNIEFGSKSAEGIKIAEIRGFFSLLKPGNYNRFRSVLFSIYNLGIENEKISFNPARGSGSKVLLKAMKEPKGRIRFLNQFPPQPGQENEETRLRKAITEHHSAHMDELDIALNTGMRRKEMYSRIRWSDVDLIRQNLSVPSSKTGLGRDISLNAAARNAFARLHARSGGTKPIFPGKAGKRLRGARHWFDDAVKKAKIEGLTWHDLRHTFASRLVMAGVDIVSISRLLGHSDLRMTMRYVHLSPSHLQSAVAKLDESSYTSNAVMEAVSSANSEIASTSAALGPHTVPVLVN